MEKDEIGAILKSRIKEFGYTQEEFAETVGIGISTLKKYMNGQTYYNVEALEMFATELDCSYDYLLGKSKTPNPEYHSIKELTDLGDGTIERLIKAAKQREDEDYVPIFDFIIQNDKLIWQMRDYLEYVNNVDIEDDIDTITEYGETAIIGQHSIRVGDVRVTKPEIPNTYLLGILSSIVEQQYTLGEDNSAVIRGRRLRY